MEFHLGNLGFVSARTHDGVPLRMVTLVDEYTRECLAWLMAMRGVPAHIRSDNGPEFTATVVRD